MNPMMRRQKGGLVSGVAPSIFSQIIKFDANYALSPVSMYVTGDLNFTMDPTGAIAGRSTTVTVKADGTHDLTVASSTVSGPGFDNTRDLLQTFTFSYGGGGYSYTVTPGVIEDLNGPAFVYAHIEDDSRDIIRLEFDEELKNYDSVGTAREMPAISAFAVSGLTIIAAYIGDYGSQLCVHVSAPVNGGETHTVSFTNPVLNQVQDYAGNAAADIVAAAITNNVVTRTTVLYDDFSLKANGAVGLPITGVALVEHDPYGGHSAISSGKFKAATGTGNGTSTTWDTGVTNYELKVSGIMPTLIRYADESNYMYLTASIYRVYLRQRIAGVESVLSSNDSRDNGHGDGATSLTSIPLRVRVTPTQIFIYDYNDQLIDTVNTSQFGSFSKVGFKTPNTTDFADFIKVVTPS